MGSVLGDIIAGHPIRALQDIPGEQAVQGFIGKGISNVIQDIENAPGGLYAVAKTAVTHPEQIPGLVENMGKQFGESLIHPGRRPGDTLMNLMMLAPGLGEVAGLGRIGEVARVASRGGELSDSLKAGIAAKQLADPTLSAQDAARQMGRVQEYDRAVNTKTGAINPVGRQIRATLTQGVPQQERLIRVGGRIDPNEGLTLQNTKQFTTPDGIVTHGWWYSRDPLIRGAQKLIDHMYETHADNPNSPIWNIARKATPFYRTQSGRFQMAAKAYNLTVQKENIAEAAQFGREWGNAGDPMHLAVRMVAEGVTPKALLKAHQRWLTAGLGPKLEAETKARMALIPEAQKLLHEREIVDPETGTVRMVPVPKDPTGDLARYVEDARKISNRRSAASLLAGALSESSHYGRLVSPFSVAHTDQVPTTLERLRRERGALTTKGGLDVAKDPDKQGRVDELNRQIAAQEHGHQLSFDVEGYHDPIASGAFKDDAEMKRFAQEANLFRVPYAFDKSSIRSRLAPGSYYRRAYGGGKPRIPGTYTHPFRGAILRGGGGEKNVARLLAESYTEAHRFIGFKAVRDRLIASSHATPESIPEEYRQLIRTDEPLRAGENITAAQALRLAQRTGTDALMDKESLSPEEMVAGGKLYEGIRQNSFPETGHIRQLLQDSKNFTAQQIDRLTGKEGVKYEPIPGYRWIDKRLLGGLEKKNPLSMAYDNAIVAKAIRGADSINTLLRGIMLYLRPAYAAPNMLGNLGLNLIHQGMLAPFHMARNYAVWRGLSKAERDIVRVQMGEGLGESGFKQMTGLGQRIQAGSAYLGKKYGKVVDEPFRSNAFLHEASNMGYSTAAEVKALLRDPKNAEDLRAVTNRANEAMINYERMGPGEESVARRLVLFYPFIKGATRYANYFFKEHPVAAGMQANLGTLGQKYVDKAFPLGLPPWMEGIIPYGGSKDFPITGNPQSMGILNEPADLARMFMNTISGHPVQGLEFAGNMAPVESSLLTLLTGGQYQSVSQKPGTPLLNEAWNALAGGLPPMTLFHRIEGKAGSGAPLQQSVYPDPSLLNAILSFGFGGGLAPRRTSAARAGYDAYRAAHPHG